MSRVLTGDQCQCWNSQFWDKKCAVNVYVQHKCDGRMGSSRDTKTCQTIPTCSFCRVNSSIGILQTIQGVFLHVMEINLAEHRPYGSNSLQTNSSSAAKNRTASYASPCRAESSGEYRDYDHAGEGYQPCRVTQNCIMGNTSSLSQWC